MRRLAALAVLIAGLVAVGQVDAAAFGGNPSDPNPPQPPPTSGTTPGQSGQPKQAAVQNCSVYATASSFGMSCLGAGGSGDVRTVKDILGKDKPPTCWDERISDATLQSVYEYTQNPDAPYYLHTCISGLNLTSSPDNQPGLVLSQDVIEIPIQAQSCKEPYTAAMTGTCVMTLTVNQHTVVSAVRSQSAQIPGVVIATYPSNRVRTAVPTAFVDRANGGETRTADYNIGGVTMYAAMDSFAIYPYGPQGGTKKPCDGTADVSPSDTPASKPRACWWTYDKSSAGQPNQVYPFRAEATWTVYVNGKPFATFGKYSDLRLPVYDVQTLVVK